MSVDLVLETALLGTARCARLAPVAIPGSLSEFFTRLQQQDVPPAHGLLNMAASLSLCARIGHEPAPVAVGAGAMPLGDREPVADSDVLLQVLALEQPRLLHEALSRMQQCSLRIPGSLLRRFMDTGSRNKDLRDAVIAVLGARGRWLAQQHDSWAWARSAASDEDVERRWAQGSLKQRLELLKQERSRDPGAARERLLADIDTLTPAERTALLGALGVNLSMDDEPMLQTLVTHERAREPRRVAMALLAMLPASAWTQRMAQRLRPLLSSSRTAGGTQWSIEPPEAVDAQWKADGLVTERPQNASTGERAWWLQQLVAAMNPHWWCQEMVMTPPQLVKWAAKGPWAEPLIRGWVHALEYATADGWAAALQEGAPSTFMYGEAAERLLAQLRPDAREAAWQQALAKSKKPAEVIEAIVNECPLGHCLSPAFSQLLATSTVTHARASGHAGYRLMSVLPQLCCLLDAGALQPLLHIEPAQDIATHVRDTLERARNVIRTRQALATWRPALSSTTTETSE